MSDALSPCTCFHLRRATRRVTQLNEVVTLDEVQRCPEGFKAGLGQCEDDRLKVRARMPERAVGITHQHRAGRGQFAVQSGAVQTGQRIDADLHDAATAAVSHLPLLLSAALVSAVSQGEQGSAVDGWVFWLNQD